jgi:hypothetical protein
VGGCAAFGVGDQVGDGKADDGVDACRGVFVVEPAQASGVGVGYREDDADGVEAEGAGAVAGDQGQRYVGEVDGGAGRVVGASKSTPLHDDENDWLVADGIDDPTVTRSCST